MEPNAKEQPLIAERRTAANQQLGANHLRFRELIAKVGSGERTSTGLNRAEAAEALERMLLGKATGAQMGAFLIAHRLRRPSSEELAGMLDAYRRLGPQLPAGSRAVISFGAPFDGRSRTAPLLPLTALVLAAAGLGVVLHGTNPIPVKYGATNGELLEGLGLPLRRLAWPQQQRLFKRRGLALMQQPVHFPAAETLVPIREQIGKRPPIATLEMLWSCHPSPNLTVSGFVHAPTEVLAGETWAQTGQREGLTVKGLEGGIDLPTSRVAVAAHWRAGKAERLLLQARDHNLRAAEPELTTLNHWRELGLSALRGDGPLATGLIWNAGFYLWRCRHGASLEAALAEAEALVRDGRAEALRRHLADELAGQTD